MVTHLFLLRISSPIMGKGRGGGHGHAQSSAEKFASSSGKREGMIVAIGLLSSGKGRDGGHGHTPLSS